MPYQHKKTKDRFLLWVSILCAAFFVTLVWLLLLLFSSDASAHKTATGWQYDRYCCNGNSESGDCQAIPSSAVKPTQSGWQVTLRPGDHRLVTRLHVFVVPYGQERRSRDDQFHACLFPSEDTLRCFYAPPMGL